MERLLIAPILLSLIIVLIALRVLSWLQRRRYRMPPAVPGIPYFGNTFQIPPLQQGKWAAEQAKNYGEMFTCKLASNTWVFLNSSRVVHDLMDKRSAIYSSRPYFPMAQGIMSGDCRMLLMPYNDRWRTLRKVMHTILNKQNMNTFAQFQDLETKHLVWDYLHTPEKWFEANQRFANSVIMSVVFGKRLSLGDPNVRALFDSSNEIIAALQPGANLVDGFYFLEWIPKPLQWWRPRGERQYSRTIKIYQNEVESLRKKMEKGVARDCFAIEFFKSPESRMYGEAQMLFALGSLMEAGSDTSRMTISQVMAAAAIDKRWVTTAREQLDSVCGHRAERLPDFKDRPRLQYITAATKEGFRWRPFAEIGVPHVLIKDDEYEGYKFPAGTVFTWNSWNIALNPSEYEDPERFWPERFLNEDLDNVLKGHYSFGPGRRVCSGYNVGESNVWIAIARLLYCFDIDEIPGQPIDSMNVNWGEHRFAPFPVKITVRSPEHQALIEREGIGAVKASY